MGGGPTHEKSSALLWLTAVAGTLTLGAGAFVLLHWFGPPAFRVAIPVALPVAASVALFGGLITGVLLVAALRLGRRRPSGGGPGGGEPLPLPQPRPRSSDVSLRRAA
jgi:hypothetical protein